MIMLKWGMLLIKRWPIAVIIFLEWQLVLSVRQLKLRQGRIMLELVSAVVLQKNTITRLLARASLVPMNVLLVGGRVNINALAACLASFTLMKEIPVLNGWDAETDSEILLKIVTMET